MVKADIVEKIQAKIGYTKKESVDILESIFAIMKSTLEAGECYPPESDLYLISPSLS